MAWPVPLSGEYQVKGNEIIMRSMKFCWTIVLCWCNILQ